MAGTRILLVATALSLLGSPAAFAAEPDAAKPAAAGEPLIHIAVADAPGDGETALAAALAKRLAAAGFKEGSPHTAGI